MNSLKNLLQRIVISRDFSLAAAEALESEIASSFPDDDRFERLETILASYRPGGGEFLFNEQALEEECLRLLSCL
jgi:hypothetical protein